jgi:alpha-tubulin suppressor-like RCC1 family protein
MADVAFCWGANDYGGIGDGTTIQRLLPTKPAGSRKWIAVSPGWWHTCGVTTDRRAYCWGFDGYGQLGDGVYHLRRLRPVAVVGGLTFTQVKAGYFHTCGITSDDRGYCWGHNGRELGSVATSNADQQETPRRMAGGLLFRALDASYYHTCGVTLGNVAYCWGDGALGNASVSQSTIPVRVAGGLQIGQVAVGFYHACGVTTDNRAYCWGGNGWGQVGDGTDEPRPTPVAVVGPM